MNSIIKKDMEEVYHRSADWRNLFNKTILITGGYGMLASYATFFLIFLNETIPEANIEIYIVGRNPQKAKIRFGEYFARPYFHFIQSDLNNLNGWDIAPDYIIHAASPASSQYYAVNPIGVISPNVFGTYNLLNLAFEKKTKSFLFVSSGEVYGTTHADSIREDEYGVSDPLDIRYCYGEGKRMGECLFKCFEYQYHVPTKIVRLGHTYGPTMDIQNDKRVFSEFVKNIVNNEDILIKSDGKPMRAFCYAADAVDAFYRVLLNGENGEAYNISNASAFVSIADLAHLLVSLFPEKKLKVEFGKRSSDEPYIESSQIKHNVPDSTKLQKLGWRCHYGLRDGFYRTVKSIEEQMN